MTFHEVRFPMDIALGAVGGPERRTDIVTLASGHEERNSLWADSRRRYNAGYGVKSLDDLHSLIAFFESRRGRLHGFRWRDAADYKSCAPLQDHTANDQAIGTGDGSERVFQLVKNYAFSGNPYARAIAKPVAGSLKVNVAGAARVENTDFTLNAANGKITFNANRIPPRGAAIKAGFLFDVPVRFDSDYLEINLTAFKSGEIPDIPIIEIRL